MEIAQYLDKLMAIAQSPKSQLDAYAAQGKKVVGCFPYYVPEELVTACGMVPFGIWGAHGTVSAAKEYFPPFYCTIAQMGLELGLSGKLDKLSGVIIPSLCDTLRPLTQNFRVALPHIPFIFLAHPQNRRPEYGIRYTQSRYTEVLRQLEAIAGTAATQEDLHAAIAAHNESRAQRRRFVRLAGARPGLVSPTQRSAVLKSAHFMDKAAHTALLKPLNDALEVGPAEDWTGPKVLVSGILADSPGLLSVLEDYRFALVADDVAQESRSFRLDVPPLEAPLLALAHHFAGQGCDPMLYDPKLTERPAHVAKLAKDSGAQGVVILMMQFCDPEELEYPSLKRALEAAGLPCVLIGYDQQMRDFGQARTQLQAFADVLGGL